MLNATTADDRAEQMLLLADKLIGHLEQEIAALAARRLDGAEINGPDKERMVHAWRIEVEHIRKDPGLIADASPALKKQLLERTAQLESTLARHLNAVDAMKSVTEGLVRSIAEEVARVRKGPAGYARNGSYGASAPSTAGGVTVNAKV